MGILDAPSLSMIQGDARYGNRQTLVPIVTRLQAAQAIADSTMVSNGTDTANMNRLTTTVTTPAHDLRLVLGNFYWGLAGLNTITVTAAIETATAAYQVTFGGKLAATLDPDAELISDPGCVPTTVAKGDTLYLRTYVSVASAGQKWPLTGYYWQTGDYVSNSIGDRTYQTGNQGGLSGVYQRAYAPVAVLGALL